MDSTDDGKPRLQLPASCEPSLTGTKPLVWIVCALIFLVQKTY